MQKHSSAMKELISKQVVQTKQMISKQAVKIVKRAEEHEQLIAKVSFQFLLTINIILFFFQNKQHSYVDLMIL